MNDTQVTPEALFGVLIVENKADLRTFYMSTLTKLGGYFVKNSATPKEALDLLETEAASIHLVIFDWQMPEIPGFVFAQKIRSRADFDHMELLVCSDHIDEQDSFLMTEIDIHFTMPKVNNAAEFTKKIEEIKTAIKSVKSIPNKIRELQHHLNEEQIDRIEDLMRIPEIKEEIDSNPRFVHLGGEFYILKKEYEDSVKYLRDFLEKNKSTPGVENLKSLSTLGKALCFQKKFDEALVIFEKLETKSPKNLGHKILVGDALMGMDNIDEAEKKYDEVLNTDNTHADALVGKGKVAVVAGDMDKAQSFFQKVHGSFESRTLASFFNNRGVSMIHKGKIEDAIKFYENSIQFLDKHKGHVYFNLGLAYIRIGNITSAVNCFNVTLGSAEAQQLSNKKILQEYVEKGQEKFIEEYQKIQK